jgi:hypothetical protein
MAFSVPLDPLEFARGLDSLDGTKTVGGASITFGCRFFRFHIDPIGLRGASPGLDQ